MRLAEEAWKRHPQSVNPPTAAGMEAVLAAQKSLVQLVAACTTGPPAKRPCFGAVGRRLKEIRKAHAKALRGAGAATPASTPASTPAGTPLATPRADLSVDGLRIAAATSG